jgi:hypothetical protein
VLNLESGSIGTGLPVLANNFTLSGSIGTGLPVLATSLLLVLRLRRPTALTSTNNTKTTNISHLFMESPESWNYNSADSMWSCVVKG